MRQVPDRTVPVFYVQDALARGYHLGFVGPSDGHNVMPGQSCIAGVNQSQTSRYYYVRAIQTEEHLAWSSPIRIDFQMNERQDL